MNPPNGTPFLPDADFLADFCHNCTRHTLDACYLYWEAVEGPVTQLRWIDGAPTCTEYAPKENDRMLTDTELQQYLDYALSHDAVFISGTPTAVLAEVIRELLALRKKQPKPTTTASLLGGEQK